MSPVGKEGVREPDTSAPSHSTSSRAGGRLSGATPWPQPESRGRGRPSRSSTSSRPTLRRMRPSPMPRARRASAGTLACVMIAGCSASDSTPPRLSAHAKTRSDSRNAFARRQAAGELEADHAAGALHLTRGDRVSRGWLEARVEDALDLRVPRRGARRASARWRRAASCARRASSGRAGPCSSRTGSARRRPTSGGSGASRASAASLVTTAPPTTSRVAVQVLRRRVHDDRRAEIERALQHRRRERVVDDELGAAPWSRSRRSPRCRRS